MLKAILFSLIPIIISIAGIMHINSNHENEVVKVPAAYGPGTGYAYQPEQWTITASPAYKWQHGTGSTTRVVIGMVLFCCTGIYIYVFQKQVWQIVWAGIMIFWLGGVAIIFGKHSFKYYEIKTYQKTISVEDYNANKDNLDIIFNL